MTGEAGARAAGERGVDPREVVAEELYGRDYLESGRGRSAYSPRVNGDGRRDEGAVANAGECSARGGQWNVGLLVLFGLIAVGTVVGLGVTIWLMLG